MKYEKPWSEKQRKNWRNGMKWGILLYDSINFKKGEEIKGFKNRNGTVFVESQRAARTHSINASGLIARNVHSHQLAQRTHRIASQPHSMLFVNRWDRRTLMIDKTEIMLFFMIFNLMCGVYMICLMYTLHRVHTVYIIIYLLS